MADQQVQFPQDPVPVAVVPAAAPPVAENQVAAPLNQQPPPPQPEGELEIQFLSFSDSLFSVHESSEGRFQNEQAEGEVFSPVFICRMNPSAGWFEG